MRFTRVSKLCGILVVLVVLCCIMLLYITYTHLRTLLSTMFTWAWNWLRITLPAGSRLLSVATATNTWSAYVITDTAMLRPDCAGSKEYTLLSGQPPTSTAADGPTTELNCRLACTITTTVKAYFNICRIHTMCAFVHLVRYVHSLHAYYKLYCLLGIISKANILFFFNSFENDLLGNAQGQCGKMAYQPSKYVQNMFWGSFQKVCVV